MGITEAKLSSPSDTLKIVQSGVVYIGLLEKASIKIILMLQHRELVEELRIIKQNASAKSQQK